MLLRFEVSNHRSIAQPVELSMVAVDAERPAARSFERLSESVLTVAGVYGPNASGKSNVIDSMAWLSSAVRLSLRYWEKDVPREPFRFGSRDILPSPRGKGPDTLSDYESAMALLRFADLGTDDIQAVVEQTEDGDTRRHLRLVHSVGEQHVPFQLVEESEGTQTWFRLIGPVLGALRTGQTLLSDEIDASLHPRLSARLLELFRILRPTRTAPS